MTTPDYSRCTRHRRPWKPVIGHDASNASRKLAELAFHVSGRRAERESPKPLEMVGAMGFEPNPHLPFQPFAGLGAQLKDRNGSQRNNYWTLPPADHGRFRRPPAKSASLGPNSIGYRAGIHTELARRRKREPTPRQPADRTQNVKEFRQHSWPVRQRERRIRSGA